MRNSALRPVLCVVGLLVVTTGAQCARQRTPNGEQATEDPRSDSTGLVRLEREARALAKTDGCNSLDQCRSAPVGERPCGGPRDYVVYCARTTDTAVLYRKLAELRQAEMEYNRKSGMMSTCEFRTPPELALSGGSCRAR
jgi:hypothetical protein